MSTFEKEERESIGKGSYETSTVSVKGIFNFLKPLKQIEQKCYDLTRMGVYYSLYTL